MNSEFDVAIVGMACRFPGARNVEEFWRNLAEGVESIAPLSDEEILQSGVPASWLSNPDYVKAAPVLEEPGHFDAAFFGFSPMEARTMDPQHRILLELAHEALEDAGQDANRFAGRIGVFTGSAMNTYFMNAGLKGRFTEEYIPTLIGNDKDFLSTRISYKLDLKGPSITVQTACSTSLVAVHLARQSLLSGETDMVLAGAISVRVPHRAGYFADAGGVTSPDGHVRAFDSKANGTVFGSGGGIIVMKRLADAIADGDTIHAVIKGSAVNNDGAEKAGYTAPSVNSQADAVVEALANAGVEADSIGYVEAHGSGTPVGDPIELRALTKAFRTSTERSGYCAIGSVKTNVGHLDAAAGIAGMIKTVLALEHRQIPPSLHFHEANPEIDFPATPFYVSTELRDWTGLVPRRAGVMATGMGGTNAHVVLEEAPEQRHMTEAGPPHLLILSAKTETALEQATDRLREFLSRNDSVNMSDVAYTLQLGRKAHPHRRCLVCADREDAIAALGQDGSNRVVSGQSGELRRPVILLLPGVGDHYVGMAHDLYETRAVFKQEVDRCARILEPHLGIDIRTVIYPDSRSWEREGKSKGIDLKKMLGAPADAPTDPEAAKLNRTLFVQPALFTIEYAMARFWQALGITADVIVGHSMGEYVAACLSGVMSLDDALRLIAVRAKLVDALPQGAMLAVMLSESELRPLLPGELSISLINGPSLCVVAGPVAAVAEFEKALSARSVICRHVQNAHAFHSRMLDPIVTAFEAEVRKVRLNEPKTPYISNVSGTWIKGGEATNPAYWASHANSTARFSDALHELWRLDNPILLEAGPGRTLGVLAMQHPERRRAGVRMAVSSIRHHYENQSDVDFLWHAIGKLWVSGMAISWGDFHSGERRRRVSLPTYPFERQKYWLESIPVPETGPRPDGMVHKNPDMSEWLYVPSWKRLLPRSIGIEEAIRSMRRAKVWLVFADESHFAAVLIARLKSAGQSVVVVTAGRAFQRVDPHTFVIEAGNSQHYVTLIGALKTSQSLPDRIVHAWSVASSRSTQSERNAFASLQALGFYSLLFLAKALATHNVGHEIDLFALSNHVQEVFGTEPLCPELSTLLGPCIVIRQEYPNIRTKSIDLDLSGQGGTYESAANLVFGEFLDSDWSLFVAYRNGQRWVQTYESVVLKTLGHVGRSFRKHGVYLITGGLGNVGVVISEYLAAKYQAKLVLLGRSSLPSRRSRNSRSRGGPADDSVDAKIRTIERLETLGAEVMYVNANVADLGAMREVIRQAHQRFGVLHGVIHGAGVVGDGVYREIKDCDFDDCERHFQAKAHGARVLEELLESVPLDFCLLLSSLTSVLGGVGQAAYAASNIYLDSFVRRHNRSSAVPWLSVNWDVWRVQRESAIDSGLGTTLRELGTSAEEATQLLETVLASKRADQLIVSTGDLGARVKQWINLGSLQHGEGAGSIDQARLTRSPRPPLSTDYGAPRDETEQRVALIWADALGINEIGVYDNFSSLGGHSLLAIRIVADLRRAFQLDLSIKVLFDAPTIAELSTYIKERIIAEIEALTDEEARLRVSSDGGV